MQWAAPVVLPGAPPPASAAPAAAPAAAPTATGAPAASPAAYPPEATGAPVAATAPVAAVPAVAAVPTVAVTCRMSRFGCETVDFLRRNRKKTSAWGLRRTSDYLPTSSCRPATQSQTPRASSHKSRRGWHVKLHGSRVAARRKCDRNCAAPQRNCARVCALLERNCALDFNPFPVAIP